MEEVKTEFMASYIPTFLLNRSTYWHYNYKQVCTSSRSEVRSTELRFRKNSIIPSSPVSPAEYQTMTWCPFFKGTAPHYNLTLYFETSLNNSHMNLFCTLLESGFKLPGNTGWLELYGANLFMAPLLFAARNGSECVFCWRAVWKGWLW
jgi:hypothetical protein